jgi:hypothetical protein
MTMGVTNEAADGDGDDAHLPYHVNGLEHL